MTASDLQTNLFPDVGTVELPVMATAMELRHTRTSRTWCRFDETSR